MRGGLGGFTGSITSGKVRSHAASCGRGSARVRRAGRVGGVARGASRDGVGGVAASGEERERRGDRHARGGGGGRPVLRVDRRAGPDAGWRLLAAPFHAADAAERVVAGQLRNGGGGAPGREKQG